MQCKPKVEFLFKYLENVFNKFDSFIFQKKKKVDKNLTVFM